MTRLSSTTTKGNFIDNQTYKEITKTGNVKKAFFSNVKMQKAFDLLQSYKKLDSDSLQRKLKENMIDFTQSDRKLLLIKRLILGPNFKFQTPATLQSCTETTLALPSQKELEKCLQDDDCLTQKELVDLNEKYGEKVREIAGVPHVHGSIKESSSSSKVAEMLIALLKYDNQQPASLRFPLRPSYVDLDANGQISALMNNYLVSSSTKGRKRSLSSSSSTCSNSSHACTLSSVFLRKPRKNFRAVIGKTYSSLTASSSESGDSITEYGATPDDWIIHTNANSSLSQYHTEEASFKYVAGRDPAEWRQFDGSLDILCKRSTLESTLTPAPFLLSMDPGYTNFFTCVSIHGDVFTLGANVLRKLKQFSKKVESMRIKFLCFKRTHPKALNSHPKIKSIKSRIQKINQLKKAVVEKLHEDCLAFLSCCDLLFLPESLESDHVEMKLMNHKAFNDKLLQKCALDGAKVVNVSEKFSTICCSACGKFRHVGSAKIFSCTGCGLEIGRDENAAWNIFLFALMRLLKCKDDSAGKGHL